MDSISIKKPFDAHIHVRRGSMLKAVTPITAEKFYSGIIMPNVEPPITTVQMAADYKKEILAALEGKGSQTSSGGLTSFSPLMTFYLTRDLSVAEIEKGARGDGEKIFAIKYYPWGATTNSQWGFRDILQAKDILKKMEEVGMPLLLHGEVHLNDHDEEEDPYDGEKLFIKEVLPKLLDAFPKLKISLEHMSSAEAIDFIEKNGKEGRLVATVTPHHLMYDRRDAFSGGYRALLHCKPLVKTQHDKEKLRALIYRGLPYVFAGTDTAPHPENKKFSSCCAFGVFNSPAAVEMYTQVFDEMNCLDKLEAFLSINGPKFYGVEPSKETLTLVKKDWQLTEPVVCDDGTKIWPVGHVQHGLGNETFHWQLK